MNQFAANLFPIDVEKLVQFGIETYLLMRYVAEETNTLNARIAMRAIVEKRDGKVDEEKQIFLRYDLSTNQYVGITP